MFSQYNGTFWDKIRRKNIEMNKAMNQVTSGADGNSSPEWDLSQVDLRDNEPRAPATSIPTIELDEDDDQVDSVSIRAEAPLRGFETAIIYPPSRVVHMIPVQRVAVTAAPTAQVALGGDSHNRSLMRRSIHENRTGVSSRASPVTVEPIAPVLNPVGMNVNRSYNKKTIAGPKDNYFSVLDTPPSPGMMPVASIFGETRSVSTEPKIVMTSNHYEKKIIRRSFDKPSPPAVSSCSIARRREKNNAPYRVLGVIDLDQEDTDTESTDQPNDPFGNVITISPESTPKTPTMEAFVSRKSLPQGTPTTPRSSKVGGGCVVSAKASVENNMQSIEIDADEKEIEDIRMELYEDEVEETEPPITTDSEPVPGSSGVTTQELDQDEDHDQCTLSDSDGSSSTAQVNPSSLANSFWDVSSSGCNKLTSDQHSSSRAKQHTAFDLLLDKINRQVPAMSQQDRIEHWRVTKEDLLYSIPTVAEIETGTSVKRPMDDPIHISSSESTDSETSDSPSLLMAKQQRTNFKKRRTGEDVANRSSPSLHLSEDLDFRRSQVNPEIDKGKGMIQCRRNYYKFPTRFDRLKESEVQENSNVSLIKLPANPYMKFLSSDEGEKEKFTGFLRRNPVYHKELLHTQQQQQKFHLPLKENKVAIVMLSPLNIKTSQETVQAPPPQRQQPERSLSADRISRYGKSRTSSVGRKLRYKVRKPQLKKKSILVVSSSHRSSYRRLIMNCKLRNGKVRMKPSLVSPIGGGKSKNRQLQRKQQRTTRQTRANSQSTEPKRVVKPPVEARISSEPPAPKSSRVSVDSAVSSSTSAEHKQQQQQSKCEPEETLPVTACNELRTMKNPLSRASGEVLAVYYVIDKLIVVQQELVSFWSCSKLMALLGLQQELQLIGQCKRAQTDAQLDSANSHRLGFNEGEPFYLEPRARNLDEDDARACPFASMYANCYFLADDDDSEDTQIVRMKSLQLDSVRSKLSDILCTPLPRSRYFMMCWHEHISETDFRTGLCKYSLTPDLETLASIREFPSISQKIVSLKSFDEDKLIGLGSTSVAIWNSTNGCLMFTVDLKIDIHVSLGAFVYTENDDKALFLLQLCPSPSGNDKRKLIKIIGINMAKRSWHLVHSYEVALESNSILCESSTISSATSLHCATFQNGEMLVLSLDDLTTCVTNHQRLQGPDGRRVTRDIVATREKIFIHPAEARQLVLVSDKFIKLKTVDEYLLAGR